MSWFIPHDVNESSYDLYAQDFPELDIQLQAPTVEFVDGEPAYVILDSPIQACPRRLVSRTFGDRSPEFKFNSRKLRLEHCPHCGEPQVVRMGDKDSEDTVCLACGETTLEELR